MAEQGQDGQNVQCVVVENLFRAYFIDAEDVGDIGVLKRIGAESGLDAGRLEELFAAGLGSEELAADQSEARAQGVSGVPTFFIHGEPIASGAQKPELLAAVLGPFARRGLRTQRDPHNLVSDWAVYDILISGGGPLDVPTRFFASRVSRTHGVRFFGRSFDSRPGFPPRRVDSGHGARRPNRSV